MIAEEGIRIRSAAAGDAAAIARIHVEAWRDSYAVLLPAEYLARLDPAIETARWVRAAEQGRHHDTLVAEAESEVVGYASAGAARDQGARGLGVMRAGEVYALYVETDWRERGVGRALIESCFRRFRAQGFGAGLIWCLEGNAAAIGFYRRCGGIMLGERRLEHIRGLALPVVGFRWDFEKA
jgi:GNAT superfamily N-acetyltransferase